MQQLKLIVDGTISIDVASSESMHRFLLAVKPSVDLFPANKEQMELMVRYVFQHQIKKRLPMVADFYKSAVAKNVCLKFLNTNNSLLIQVFLHGP